MDAHLEDLVRTTQQKNSINSCTHCHALEPVVRSTHNADEFEQVLARMAAYTPQ